MHRFEDLVTIEAPESQLVAVGTKLATLPSMTAQMLAGPFLERGVGISFIAPIVEGAIAHDRQFEGADCPEADPAMAPKHSAEQYANEERVDRRLLVVLRVRQKRVADAVKLLPPVEAAYLDVIRNMSADAGARYRAKLAITRSMVADALGHKADALAFALAAHEAEPDSNWLSEDRRTSSWAPASVTRLWRQLGGTAAGETALVERGAKEPSNVWSEATQQAPLLGLSDLNGKTWTAAELRGKTVLVNYWATWCSACKAELPHLQALYDEVRSQDVVVLAVNVDDDIGLVSKFVADHKMTMPVLLSPASSPSEGLPYNVIVDKSGTARFSLLGVPRSGDWVAMAKAKLADAAK